MSCWALVTLSILLLFVPRAILPSWQALANKRARPEIHGWLTILHAMTIGYCGLWHRLKTNGWAPLPETGPAILIANHTCGIDHLILQAGCRRVLGFMIAREYYEWPRIAYFCKLVGCIPVNRDGRDLQATRAALRALEDGRVLPVFPEGKITPASGEVLGEMRPGAAFIAIRAGVPVIPAYIRGTPRTDQIGESLITLSRAEVTFGNPIDLSSFDRRQAGDKAVQAEVSRRFMQALLDLRDHGMTTGVAADKAEPAHDLQSDTSDAA
jgi:1-acyl-sn-glycerol-3-phosphate acyltransferase